MKNYIEETLLVITITVMSFILYWYYFEARLEEGEFITYALIFPALLLLFLTVIYLLKKYGKK